MATLLQFPGSARYGRPLEAKRLDRVEGQKDRLLSLDQVLAGCRPGGGGVLLPGRPTTPEPASTTWDTE